MDVMRGRIDLGVAPKVKVKLHFSASSAVIVEIEETKSIPQPLVMTQIGSLQSAPQVERTCNMTLEPFSFVLWLFLFFRVTLSAKDLWRKGV